MIQAFIRRFSCAHNMQHVRNIYGDEIIQSGYKRSIWKCTKCGKVEYRAAIQASSNTGSDHA